MTRLGLEQAALIVLLAVLAVVEILHHLGVLLGGKLLNHPVKITVSYCWGFHLDRQKNQVKAEWYQI